MDRQRRIRASIVLIAVACMVTTPLSGGSENAPTDHTIFIPATGGTPAATAAMRAYRNPETGALEVGAGPVIPSLDPQTQNAMRRDADGLVETHHPDGSVSIDLQGRFQSVSLIRIDAHGRTVTCTDNTESARKVLEGDEPAVLE